MKAPNTHLQASAAAQTLADRPMKLHISSSNLQGKATSHEHRSVQEGSVRMRIRCVSTTAKCPGQSSRKAMACDTAAATWLEELWGMRKSTIPQGAGRRAWKLNSAKSLSNVSSTRSSATARSNTCRSALPGASVLTQPTSCPERRSDSTASRGKFSFARKRMRLFKPVRRDTPARLKAIHRRNSGRLECLHAPVPGNSAILPTPATLGPAGQ